MPELEWVDPRNLRPGPIQHESLPPKLLMQIREIHRAIGQYLDTTLEQFETNFMRDLNPDREVAVWCLITAAWVVYHKKYLGNQRQADSDERKLVGALLLITMGIDDTEKLGVPVDVGAKLLKLVEQLHRVRSDQE